MGRDSHKKMERGVKTGRDSTGLPIEEMDNIGLNWTRFTLFAGATGLLVFLGVFFMTDLGDRIIASKQQSVYASSVQTAKDKGSDDLTDAVDTNTFHIALFADGQPTKSDVLRYLESLSDAEFEQFKKAILVKITAEHVEHIPTAHTLFTALQDGTVSSKADVIAALQAMPDTEFDALIKAIITIDNPNANPQDDGVFQSSLEAAYAEAEKRYPGQIDGSKRLKLVADLNAIDYLYYVAEYGDTLLELSQAFNVPLGQLVELNGIHDADLIYAGEIILFPSDTVQPPIAE